MSPASVPHRNFFSDAIARMSAGTLVSAILFSLAIAGMPAHAQTFTVLHAFTGFEDGSEPEAGLTMDADGNFYGTTYGYGTTTLGTVFELARAGSGWVLTPLYDFSGVDGAYPAGRVAIGVDGTLYGTTAGGGNPNCRYVGYAGCGLVFQLTPTAGSKTHPASWTMTVLYQFSGSDGANPQGDLSFDTEGNIYGTTQSGGSTNNGVIYKLTPSSGGWTETVLYSAQNNGDGALPNGGVVLDSSGNLYGVFTYGGPNGLGAVYQLSPSGSGWTERTLHGFAGSDGANPFGGLIMDSPGNIYGSTPFGGGGAGTVFQMVYTNDSWTFSTLYSFSAFGQPGPEDKLTLDAAGNLFGATYEYGLYGRGSVFRLTPSSGGWTYASLHDFIGGPDGYGPNGNLILDSTGNLYGTTANSVPPALIWVGIGNAIEITPESSCQ